MQKGNDMSAPSDGETRNRVGRREFLGLGAGGALAGLLPRTAAAYPTRPIRLIVPFSPGGATDVAARLWADRMRASLGTVVIENRGGGGGIIGAAEVARSQPDGQTLLFGNTSTQVLIPAAMRQPPFDPIKDFSGIYIVCLSAICIVVHQSMPVRTLAELISYAKSHPNELSYGSAGVGTLTNLAGELFKTLIGVPGITHVPYKGSAPGIMDLAGGVVPMMTPNIGLPLLEFHRAGKVRILAICARQRIEAAPEIPTAAEAGLPDMVAVMFNGVFAPAGVSKAIVQQIAQATREMLVEKEVQASLVRSGFEPDVGSGPGPADRMVVDERNRWIPVINSSGFRL